MMLTLSGPMLNVSVLFSALNYTLIRLSEYSLIRIVGEKKENHELEEEK